MHYTQLCYTEYNYINYAHNKEIKVDSKEIRIVEEYISKGKVARTNEGMTVELNRRLLSG